MEGAVAGGRVVQGHSVSQVLDRGPVFRLNWRSCGASIQSSKLFVVRANQLTCDHQDHAEVDLLKCPSVAEKQNGPQSEENQHDKYIFHSNNKLIHIFIM